MDNTKNIINPFDSTHNYGIDLFRIVSMMMVVTLHVLGHGGILSAAVSVNYWVLWLLEIMVFCAVNCYALISGYVGVCAKYKLSNLVVLWLRVLFYTVSITLICKCLFPESVDTRTLVSAFFPVISNHYWYFSSYVLLFLLIPVLNEGLNRLSKESLGFILLAIITGASLLRPFVRLLGGDVFALLDGYSAWWLMILYLIGGYIRKYGLFNKLKSHRTVIFFVLYIASASITLLSKLCIGFISKRVLGAVQYDGLLVHFQSITILAEAVFLLLAFEHIKTGRLFSKILVFLSPLTFGVYLIHEQFQIKSRIVVDRFAWIATLPVYCAIPLIILIVLCIYVICSIIELLRFWLFKIFRVKERCEQLELIIRTRLGKQRNHS